MTNRLGACIKARLYAPCHYTVPVNLIKDSVAKNDSNAHGPSKSTSISEGAVRDDGFRYEW